MSVLHDLFEKIVSCVSGDALATVVELRERLSSRMTYINYKKLLVDSCFLDSHGRVQSPFVNCLSDTERPLLEFLLTFQPRAILYLIDSSLELVRFLGQGDVAKVYLVRKERKEYALKVLKKPNTFSVFGTEFTLMREFSILQHLSGIHGIPRAVLLYTSVPCAEVVASGSYAFLMEYIPGKSLELSSVSLYTRRRCYELLDAIHEQNYTIPKFDWKPDNILLVSAEQGMEPYFIDFFFAILLSSSVRIRSQQVADAQLRLATVLEG